MRAAVALVLAAGLAMAGCIKVDVPGDGTAEPTASPTSGAPTGPSVAFTWSPAEPQAGSPVAFRPDVRVLRGSTVLSWSWDFGDGSAATKATPSHTYLSGGPKTVTLKVLTSDGQDGQAARIVPVREPGRGPTLPDGGETPAGPPVATATATSLGFRFSYAWDLEVEQQAWDFGDGTTSQEASPVHQYRVPGPYTATVSVLSTTGLLAGASVDLVVTDAPISFFLTATGGTGGEPSIGVLGDGTVFTAVNPEAYRSLDAGRSWEVVSDTSSAPLGFDPYLWTDQDTDRVFHLNLYIGCSYLSFSDDRGDTWTTNPVACGAPVNDHQKLATGAFRAPLVPTVYPNVVYYASNQLAGSSVSFSLDGGVTWAPGTLGTPGTCGSGGTNGQPHGGPTGVAYLPYYDCDELYVARSETNGLTWSPVVVDSTTGTGHWDPDLDSDDGGTTYIAWHGSDYQVFIAHTKDEGRTWSRPLRLTPDGTGTTFFPTIVAGGPGRVAVSYIATNRTAESPDMLPPTTEWFLYTTFVEGADTDSPSRLTVRATPEPIQRGEVCTGGLGCDLPGGNGNKRNLLEFIDSRMDPSTGRLWITYTDGCDGCSSSSESTKSINKVARLDVGPSLLDGRPLRPP